MKKNLSLLLLTLISVVSFAQENDSIKGINFDSEIFLKEISDNACQCIDSISAYNKSRKEVASEIHTCIDKQCGAYQLGIKLSQIKDLKTTVGEKKEVNIDLNVNLNPESNEYKKYYYEIETYLMTNCAAIKAKISANDKLGIKSMSSDSEALKYYNLGLEAGKNGDFEKAIDNYKKAVVFDPEFAFAYDNMGVCYRRLNRFDDAIEAYEKSLKIDPNGQMPLQNIGIAYLYKKEYRKALKSYERLSKIDPNNPEVFYGIGNIYAQHLFEYEKALDNLCKAYNIYVEQKSPYRSDAEKLIQLVYSEMKKQGKESTFNEILEKNGIKAN
ncbi:tetratricopeptide repeat protein [Flavobacterium sp. J49]|uniref:tetratricopeptide repeat protein n=1 Tax=Flavobacterium sp. J49 TaxID=2718534 RepID=UPI001592FA6A|nr:tetratricopeptide repeat protein [Flavobacterium sp. J49]MBF6641010.1 tetratricopeptide repeat protein [Flavobacterium sp. J49]NIC02257.1 tetratricopeptide repeat protein [Flavobacterium sp. J49]